MKVDLETTLHRLAEVLRPYRATVELTASTPYVGDPWLNIAIESAEWLAEARNKVAKVVAECASRLHFAVYAPLDGRVVLSLWNRIGYFEGLRLLTDYLEAIAIKIPPDAPHDINGFAVWLTDHSTDQGDVDDHAPVRSGTNIGIRAGSGIVPARPSGSRQLGNVRRQSIGESPPVGGPRFPAGDIGGEVRKFVQNAR